MRTRTVLAPLDDTILSRMIIPAIEEVLNPADYKVILLRVGDPVTGVIGKPPRPASLEIPLAVYERAEDLTYSRHPIYATQVEDSAEAALAYSLDEARIELLAAGFEVDVQILFGDPVEEIVRCAETEDVDMIAIATRNGPPLRQAVFGSVAASVVRRTHRPVLLLHPANPQEEARDEVDSMVS